MIVYKYRIRCITEGIDKYVWASETDPVPNACPTDTAHTIDPNLTAIVDQVGSSVLPVKIDNPIDTEGLPVFVSAPYSPVREYLQIGNADAPYVCQVNAVNIFDLKVDVTMVDAQGSCLLFGGEYWTDGNFLGGDYAEFSVVDKDNVLGLFASYGLTPGVDVLEIVKYVRKRPLFPNIHDSIQPGGAKKLVRGLYLRVLVSTINSGIVRKLYVTYNMAK